MSTETRVEQALRGWLDLHGIGSNQTVHLAVSGGLDSMALLHASHAVHPHLHVLHVDHGLRPESDADRAFVEEVARTLSVPVTAHRSMDSGKARLSADKAWRRRPGLPVMIGCASKWGPKAFS